MASAQTKRSYVRIYTSQLQCKQYSFGSVAHILDISASLF